MKEWHENRKSIFEELFDKGVCFAVCVVSTRFANKDAQVFSREYSVLLCCDDADRIEGFAFSRVEGYKLVCERKLSPGDIQQFRSMPERFVKVIHNAHGRVYELRDKSFKAAFDHLREQTRFKGIEEIEITKNKKA